MIQFQLFLYTLPRFRYCCAQIFKATCLSYLLLSLCSFEEGPALDLEEFSQEFILETKKIAIPQFPHAFNPSIVRWRGRLLLSFRIIPDVKRSYNSEIGLVFLNEELEPMSEPQLVCLRREDELAPNRAEDAHLITIDDRLFMIYDDNKEIKISRGGFRIYVSELHYDGEHFIAYPIEGLFDYEGESRQIREKSWVPFVYEDQLLLAYSLNPHKIFHPKLDESGVCETVALSKSGFSWDFGVLRGGTPAILVGDEYLAFFHSSKPLTSIHSEGKEITHYFMGAYTFSKDPPFRITAISPSPVIGPGFYNGITYPYYWKPICCVFPRGIIEDKDFIWVTYGRNDHESWIAKLDKNKLLESLIPAMEK